MSQSNNANSQQEIKDKPQPLMEKIMAVLLNGWIGFLAMVMPDEPDIDKKNK